MIHAEQSRRRIDAFPTRCREAGLKVTPQRVAVYAMLASTDTHPTPEVIYSTIRQEIPSISLGTVYKILDLLTERGLLRRVATSNQAARYDARTDDHHHALCRRCGRIEDTVLPGAPQGPVEVSGESGFQVAQVDVLLHGLCAECRGQEQARA